MRSWQMHFSPKLNLTSPDIIKLLVEIEAYRLSVLKIPLPPKQRAKFDQLNILRQIKGTTGIEGNPLSEEQIEQVLGSAAPVAASLEEREVINADLVLKFIQDYVKNDPSPQVTPTLIKTLHRLSTEGCNYPNNVPGEYRQHNVTAGEYRPPEYGEIEELMIKFTDLINSRRTTDALRPLVRAILAHFYLVTIHPFGDGNGRTSRALEAFILYQGGYNVRGFYSLANFYYRNRQRYIDHLQEARFLHNGDLTAFVRFSLEGFLTELQRIQEEILSFVRRVLFRDLYLEAYKKRVINDRALAVVEYLTFDAPPGGIETEGFRTKTHYLSKGLYESKTQKTINRDLKALQEHRLVVNRNGHLLPNLELMNEYT